MIVNPFVHSELNQLKIGDFDMNSYSDGMVPLDSCTAIHDKKKWCKAKHIFDNTNDKDASHATHDVDHSLLIQNGCDPLFAIKYASHADITFDHHLGKLMEYQLKKTLIVWEANSKSKRKL